MSRSGFLGKYLVAVFGSIFLIFSASIPVNASTLSPKATYLIQFKSSSRSAVESEIAKAGGTVEDRYRYIFEGVKVEIPVVMVKSLSRLSNIVLIEPDIKVTLETNQVQTPTPSWGLDRIDQRGQVSSSTPSSYGYKSGGTGTTVYIADTGISRHNDFGVRLSATGYSAFSDSRGFSDCNGHGTHVASTVAGTSYGVAKNAKLVAVRVLDCNGSGSLSGVVAGLDWILSPQNTNSKSQAVVNMSLGGGVSTMLDSSVQRLTNAGVTVVVAAGNDNRSACLSSPARAASAITVGSTDIRDAKSSFSNHGTCVDIHAPGSSITGAWWDSTSATRTISGTSMASPHVAGAAAVYLGIKSDATVAEVTQYLLREATNGVVTGLPVDTVNKLLYVSPTDNAPISIDPTISLAAVQSITSTSAQVSFRVNPGTGSANLSLVLSTDPALANSRTVTISPSAISGDTAVTAVGNITGLSPNTIYFVQLSATTSTATTRSAIETFTTSPTASAVPTVSVLPATEVTAYSAILQGTANAANTSVRLNFVYSTDVNFAKDVVTVVASTELLSGNLTTNVSAPISFLDSGKTYYFKLIAISSSATTYSSSSSFSVQVAPGVPPTVLTNRLSSGASSVETIFTGQIDPKGQTTTVRFTYGTSSSLTRATSFVIPGSPITGDSAQQVTAAVRGLTPGLGFYYRFEASNASGVAQGGIHYVIVDPVKAEFRRSYANNQTGYTARLNATVNAGGSNTRWSFTYGTDQTLTSGTTTLAASPNAVTHANDVTVTLNLSGLTPSTTYYYQPVVQILTGPFSGQTLRGPIQSFGTLNVAPPTVPTPGKQLQTINFAAIANREYGAAVPLSASATSGLPIAFSSLTPGICYLFSLSGTQMVQYVNPVSSAHSVTCSIAADQAGNASFDAAARVIRSFTYSKNAMEITVFPSGSITSAGTFVWGELATVDRALMNGLPSLAELLTVTSSTPSICAVSNVQSISQGSRGTNTRSTVKAISNGLCSVKFSYTGAGTFAAKETIWTTTISGVTPPPTVPIEKSNQVITFPTIANREFGPGVSLQATSSSKLPVSYSVLTPEICRVLEPTTGNFVVQTAANLPDVETATCTIVANQTGNSSFNPAGPVSQSFTWRKAAQQITTSAIPTIRVSTGASLVTARLATVDRSLMSGLVSLNTLITATSLTPSICVVTQNDLISVGTSPYSRIYIRGLATGSCRISLFGPGLSRRAPVTLEINANVSASTSRSGG